MQYTYTNEQDLTASIRISYRDVRYLIKIIEQVENKQWYHDELISELKEIRKSMAQSVSAFYGYQVQNIESDEAF